MAVIGRHVRKWYLASKPAMNPSAIAKFSSVKALADSQASSRCLCATALSVAARGSVIVDNTHRDLAAIGKCRQKRATLPETVVQANAKLMSQRRRCRGGDLIEECSV